MKRIFAFFSFLLFIQSSVFAQSSAVGGVVSGNVQEVGFRAFIFRQAIAQNLGGWVANLPDGRVSFVLYGKEERISKAIDRIKEGPDKADVSKVEFWKPAPPPGPATFTVYGWTSESRNLHTPRDLVFQKRSDDSVLDSGQSKKVYHQILHTAGVE